MREIKFREFYKKENIMYRDIDISNECLPIHDNNVVIMQYTGLKDKNGVEIYEGDIMVLDGNTLLPLVVKYKYNMFVIKHNNSNNCFIGEPYFNTFEVIGNIYENPELLELE